MIRKLLIIVLSILVVIYGAFIFFGQQAKENALAIFNDKMSTQKGFHGKISVGDLDAHLDGTVNFKDLAWVNTKGEPLVKVGKGYLKVHLWDALTGKVGARSVSTIELENAELVLRFDEQKKADVIPKKEIPQEATPEEAQTKEDRNLDLSDKIGPKKVIIKNSIFTVVDKERVYTLNGVNGTFRYDKGILKLDLKTGKFGGTLEGDSLELAGQVEIAPGKDKVDLNGKINNLVPSTLGIRNITNKVSLTGKLTGTIKKLKADGTIVFANLDLPKMHFTNVSSNYHYEDDVIHIMDLSGNLFSGRIDAFGEYNLKTKAHKIFVTGHDLEASEYFTAKNLQCKLKLEMQMINDGTKHGSTYRGYLFAGEGKLGKYSFHNIESRFDIVGKDLHFKKVILDTDLGELHASSIDVVNKKMKLHGVTWHPHHAIKRAEKNKHRSKDSYKRK